MRRGISILEVVIVIVIAAMLMALLIPALMAAREAARRSQCASNQRAIGTAWQQYVRETGEFPSISDGGGPWSYAGVTFSRVDGRPTLDYSRPINRHISPQWARQGDVIFESPVDRGIDPGRSGDPQVESAYRTHGTSYRANDALFATGSALRRAAIAADPSRLVIMGGPFWYESLHQTGRSAAWYGAENSGIVLFMDNSTRTIQIEAGQFATALYTFTPGLRGADPSPANEERTGQ